MSHSSRSNTIEFTVRPREDLFLEGKNASILRVVEGESYPCQMQKNQTFNCLFRHYAKHNGLDKENLLFTFVDELQADEMPESVHLMPLDDIWVEHRRKVIGPKHGAKRPSSLPRNPFTDQFRELLFSSDHSDISFLVGDSKEEVAAHRAVLSVRCAYFKALFRTGGMKESYHSSMCIEQEVNIFKLMLEYIYTNTIENLGVVSVDNLVSLLILANEYLLDDLKILCEEEITNKNVIDSENLAKFILISKEYNASCLRSFCQKYLVNHIEELKSHESFRREYADSPELALLVLDTIGKDSGRNRDNKRRRVTRDPAESVTAIEHRRVIHNGNHRDYIGPPDLV